MQQQLFPDNGRDAVDFWRAKLQQAQDQYQAASSFYRKVLAQQPGGGEPHMVLLRLARDAETRALAEFRRMLGIFSDLTLHGKMPGDTPMPAACPRFVSVVDDDESIRDSTTLLLRSAGYDVRTFESAERFLESDALEDTGCLILDVKLSGMDGLELQRRLDARARRIPIIFVTARDDRAAARRAIQGGAVEFFCKPYNANALIATVQAAFQASESQAAESPAGNGK